MNLPLIVIGAGLAGWTTIREFRKLDPDTPVTLITADSAEIRAFRAEFKDIIVKPLFGNGGKAAPIV
jgi:glutathione synthase/RimK-type ligase-like ATP-grasp enzyme